MKHIYSIFVIIVGVLVFVLQGCGTDASENPVLSSGRHNGVAGIIHGMEIPESNHPETVKILIGKALCTGVFVKENPPTLLTASHCLKDLPNAIGNDGGIQYAATKSRRACVPEGAAGKVGSFDYAVVVFEKDSFQVPAVAILSEVAPAPGMDVTLVGYGRNTGETGAKITGAGKKRLGMNRISQIMDSTPKHLEDMIELKGAVVGDLPEEQIKKDYDSSPNHGDSGGPLYLNLPGGDVVAGLVSGGRVLDGVTTAYYTNLLSARSRAFLQKALDPVFLDRLSEKETPADYKEVCAVQE